MIYIVHGDDISTSRKLIVNQQIKLGIENKTEFSITDLTPQDLINIVTQGTIFEQSQMIVLDISGAGRTKLDKHIEALKLVPEKTAVVILAESSLPKGNQFLKSAAVLKAKIIHTELEQKGNVFNFADSVFYKNRRKAYRELSVLLNEGHDEFRLYSILYYVLRNIACAKFGAPSFEKLQPFQKTKFKKQADLFTEKELTELFHIFYLNDKQAKTGEITPELMITRTIEKVLNS